MAIKPERITDAGAVFTGNDYFHALHPLAITGIWFCRKGLQLALGALSPFQALLSGQCSALQAVPQHHARRHPKALACRIEMGGQNGESLAAPAVAIHYLQNESSIISVT
jgi:hypothetical protein